MTGTQPPGVPAGGPAMGTTPQDSAGVTTAGGAHPRPRRPRPRRRHTPWRAAFFVLAGAGIVAAVAWTFLSSRFFVVRSVTVTGTHLVAPEQVIAIADVPLGTPLLRVDAGAITRRVEAIRQVASATVSEGWPDHLTIVVTERVPALAVRMAGGGYDLIDHTGTIVRWTKTRPVDLPLLTRPLTGSAMRGDPGVAAAADVLAELDPALARSVASVSVAMVAAGDGDPVATAPRVRLSLRGGKTVVWGDPGGAAQKNRELAIMLGRPVRYIDVSAAGTVVTG